MPNTLILGGTRNLGHVTALSLLDAGHDVTVLNRGQTVDDLPPEVQRVRADRNDDASIRAAIGDASFDLVLDTTTYTERDARQAVSLFEGRAARYVFISSGQVYLVREDLPRPYGQSDYFGPVMTSPPADSPDYSSWLYGIDKRLAEQIFLDAASASRFPVITLRLPMVASERDHYGRIQGYVARLMDGGPLMIPAEAGLPLRHVYVNDVARLITRLVDRQVQPGTAYNVSYGESLSLDSFLELLASITGSESQVLRIERAILDEHDMQYLYTDGDSFHFMNTQSFEQLHIDAEALGESVDYLIPDALIKVEFYGEEPVGIELPPTVDLTAEPRNRVATPVAPRHVSTPPAAVTTSPSAVASVPASTYVIPAMRLPEIAPAPVWPAPRSACAIPGGAASSRTSSFAET